MSGAMYFWAIPAVGNTPPLRSSASTQPRREGFGLADGFHSRPHDLDQIEQAAARSIAAFSFLPKTTTSPTMAVDQAVPRDNVVFEAGYFIGLKESATC